MKEKTKITDIYIKPDISDYGVISFDEGQEIIKKGEEAALLQIDAITKLADPSGSYKVQNFKVLRDTLFIKSINTNKLDNYTRAYILGKLRFKNGSTIRYEELKKGINNINATQNFSRISYTLEPYEGGDELQLNLTENPTKTFLKFGLHYDGLYKSAILANITQKKSLFKNDVASLDIILGDNIRYNFDYYIDNGFYWSFGLKSRYNSFNRNVETDFRDGELLSQLGLNSLNIDFSDLTNQVYMQTVFIQKFLIGAGLEHKYLKIRSDNLGTVSPTFEKSDYASVFGYMKFDSFDNKLFPKKGWMFSGDIQSFLYSSDYTNEFDRYSIAKGEVGMAKTFYKKFTVKVQSEAGFTIGNDSVHFFDFILGGYGFNTINNFKHFYGYDFLSIAADSYIKSCITLDYEIYKKNHINFAANYANIEDGLFRDGDWLSKPKYNGYAIGYALESAIGPIEIKHTWSPEQSKGYTFISIGFWF